MVQILASITFPITPAKKSSITTPTPLPNFCTEYIGPIFVISKILKITKARAAAIKLFLKPTGFIKSKVVK